MTKLWIMALLKYATNINFPTGQPASFLGVLLLEIVVFPESQTNTKCLYTPLVTMTEASITNHMFSKFLEISAGCLNFEA